MDAVIEAAKAESDLLSSTHRKRILADLDYAGIAERLVTCRTDLIIEGAEVNGWKERSNLIEFRRRAKDWELGSTIERITAALDL